MMNSPAVLAAAIGSAFDAAELPLVDPATLTPVGMPPKVFPRVMSIDVAEAMRRKFEAWRSRQDDGRSAELQAEDRLRGNARFDRPAAGGGQQDEIDG